MDSHITRYKWVLIIILFALVNRDIAIAQINDSTIYYQLLKKPNTLKVYYYYEYYPNGSIKIEGWMHRERYVKATSNYSMPMGVTVPYTETKYGTWKTYYKSGKLYCLNESSIDSSKENTEVYFSEKGDTTYASSFVLKENRKVKLGGSATRAGKLSNLGYFHFKKYSKGKLKKTGVYAPGGKKDMLWKHFKNGALVKEIEYQNGTKIKLTRF